MDRKTRHQTANNFLICFLVGVGVGFAVGSSLATPLQEEEESWTYPESELHNVLALAEELHSARWSCTHESCIKDFTKLSQMLYLSADRLQVDVRLLQGILMVENPWFDVSAVSSAGALGLMQVMPFHVFAECEALGGLKSLEGNLCAGTKVLEMYLERGLRSALLFYNGCAWESCAGYAGRVLSYVE